jgi:uncharacterized iron-regulated membrane protein
MRVTSSSASVHSQQRIRHTLRTLHLWLGLSVGLMFAIVSLCGTILTFQNDLLLLQYPQLANHALPDPAQRAAVLETIYKTKWPGPLMSAEAPDEKLPVWQVYLGGDMRAYVDPATGAQLLTRSAQNDWLLFIRKLHTHLLSGEVGEQVLGVIALLAVALLLIGLTLWWPRRGHMGASLTVHAQPPTRRWRSLHQTFGALLFPLILFSAATGAAMIYKSQVRAGLHTLFADSKPDIKMPAPLAARDEPIRWADSLAAAQRALPDAELRRITLPGKKSAALIVRARDPDDWNRAGRSVVVVDPYTAQVLSVNDASKQDTGGRVSDRLNPLHAAAVGGRAWQLLIAFSGLLPAFFLTTGFLFWRARRRRTAATSR